MEFAVTALTALFIAGGWSRLRWGFFDLFCFAAALAGAFAAPWLMTRYFPDFVEFGDIAADVGGAFVGCAIYDAASYGLK